MSAPEASDQGGVPDRADQGEATAYPPAEWRRLDARMLAVHPVQEAVRFLPALLAVFLTGRTSQRSPWWDWGLLAAVVAFGLSRWFTTRYRIWNGQIELRHGLLFRSARSTPAERVRTVDLTATPWHRLLGLARVEVGTGGAPGTERIVLDALAAPAAERLRGELLHARTGFQSGDPAATRPIAPGPDTVPAPGPAAGPAETGPAETGPAETGPVETGPVETGPVETELLRLDPAWVRYAPLTTSGLVSAVAIWGVAVHYLGDELGRIGTAVASLESLGLTMAVLVVLGGLLVVVSVLAVTAYVLSHWGFRLTRHAGGTLHTRRGLLTSRATSIDEGRLRGVEIGRPLGLRLAGAARLSAVTTGLGTLPGMPEGSSWLSPPAPRAVVERTALAVVGDPEAVAGELTPHGPAARRRRYTRAVGGGVVIAAAALAARWQWGIAGPLVALGALPLLLSPLLAADRYAALGHRLTPRHLVVRSGSLARRRDVIQRDGVIGVVLRESFFQRRAGIATLTATTAAGNQGYDAIDVRRARAVELSVALLPACLADLVAPEVGVQQRPGAATRGDSGPDCPPAG